MEDFTIVDVHALFAVLDVLGAAAIHLEYQGALAVAVSIIHSSSCFFVPLAEIIWTHVFIPCLWRL